MASSTLLPLKKGWDRFRLNPTAELVIIPSLTGLLTGVAAIGFVELIDLVQWVAIGSREWPLKVIPHLPWYHLFLIPILGGLIVGPLVNKVSPEAEGHGVPEVIETVMVRGGRMRPRVALVKSVASAVTIGTGGSVGREGPIVQIGASIGSTIGRLFRLPPEQLRTLAACGTAGGIAAVFNAPIAGAFFALEVITRNFATRAFGPVILSSVLATVVSRAYFGDTPAFVVQPYELESALELAAYAGLGVLSGALGALFVRTMDRFETLASRIPVPRMWHTALGGAALGALFLVMPNLYGVGYGTMDGALSGNIAWEWLGLLTLGKIVATSLTIASGGSGGVFLPSLFIGSVGGGLFGCGVHGLFPGLTASSGAYALVGMAGVLAAATHSPITAMLLLVEITGDYKIILPVMIVVTLATLVGRALEEESLYTLKLSRRGTALRRHEELILRTHTVGQVMQPPAHVLADRTPIEEVLRYFLMHDAAIVYVTDGEGRLAGAISIHDIKDPEVGQLGPLVLAVDLAEPNLLKVLPHDTLADCMDRFVVSDRDELPVVTEAGLLAGVVTRRQVLQVFSSELLRQVFLDVSIRDQRVESVQDMLHLGQGLTIARMEVPRALAGRSLRDANLRAAYHLTVVAMRHPDDTADRLPDPAEPLAADDVLVVVGKPSDLERFRLGDANGGT
ncbi:MAG: chloride channel protein [bacterium]